MASILILDNDPTVCKFMESLLSKHHNAIACQDWESARKVLRDVQFDLVLIDIHLGDRRGSELVGEVRKCQKALVVLFSSSNKDYIMAQCRHFMADGYLKKAHRGEAMLKALSPFLRKDTPLPMKAEQSFFASAMAWDESNDEWYDCLEDPV